MVSYYWMAGISYSDLESKADEAAKEAWEEAYYCGSDEDECDDIAREAYDEFIAAWWESGDALRDGE